MANRTKLSRQQRAARLKEERSSPPSPNKERARKLAEQLKFGKPGSLKRKAFAFFGVKPKRK